jgi:uncharacterized OB-fold protein
MSEPVDLKAIIRGVGGDVADLPFWEACQEGRFLVHRCGVCGRSYWPASRCVEHSGEAMQWVEASGKASLYTYTVMHHAYTPAMQGKTPYVVGVVKLEEGPFFHTNVVECAIEDVAIGMPLEVVMQRQANGMTLPMFRPAK